MFNPPYILGDIPRFVLPMKADIALTFINRVFTFLLFKNTKKRYELYIKKNKKSKLFVIYFELICYHKSIESFYLAMDQQKKTIGHFSFIENMLSNRHGTNSTILKYTKNESSVKLQQKKMVKLIVRMWMCCTISVDYRKVDSL